MLRGLQFGGIGVFDSSAQPSHEDLHVAVTSQFAEAPFGIAECTGDPSQRHLPVFPALDVAREGAIDPFKFSIGLVVRNVR